MQRPYRQAHKTHATQYFADAAFMVGNAKLFFDNSFQVNAPPPDERSFRRLLDN